MLNLALAHDKAGDYNGAKYLLDRVDNGHPYDTLKYLAISVPVLENLGHYKNALAAYRGFSKIMDSINSLKFEQTVKSVEHRHKIELQSMLTAQRHHRIILGCAGGMIMLFMVAAIFFLLFRSNRNAKSLATERARISELENECLKSANMKETQKVKISKLENERLQS